MSLLLCEQKKGGDNCILLRDKDDIYGKQFRKIQITNVIIDENMPAILNVERTTSPSIGMGTAYECVGMLRCNVRRIVDKDTNRVFRGLNCKCSSLEEELRVWGESS